MNTAPAAARRRRIAVLDADAALVGLLAAWLSGWGEVVAGASAEGAPGSDLMLVDVPFPRLMAPGGLRALAQRHPGVPLIALSPTFFPGIASRGPVAQQLGVTAVLPKPVPREALLQAVQELLGVAT